MGRELIFSRPEIIQILNEKFIPYAGDQWYLHRQKDQDGVYFWKVAQQGHNRNLPEDSTRQGIYVATPDGALLASSPFRPDYKAVHRMLQQSLERGSPVAETAAPAAPEIDDRYLRRPPAGGLILKSYTRIPLEPEDGKWTMNQATGRDHVWLTAEEVAALRPRQWRAGERYKAPPSLVARLVRFHLVDNVRGEPPMWRPDEVKSASLNLIVDDPAAGRVRLEGAAGLSSPENRGYDARIQGYLTFDREAGTVKGLDLLAWGEAWGQGPYTRNAPKGRFPLVIAMSKAGNSPADQTPPQAAREIREYLTPTWTQSP